LGEHRLGGVRAGSRGNRYASPDSQGRCSTILGRDHSEVLVHSSGRPRTTGTAKLSRMSGTSRSARSGTLGRQGFRDDIWPARRPLDIVVAGEVTAHCSQRENVRQPFRFVNGKRFGESSSAGRSRRHGRRRADPCPRPGSRGAVLAESVQVIGTGPPGPEPGSCPHRARWAGSVRSRSNVSSRMAQMCHFAALAASSY